MKDIKFKIGDKKYEANVVEKEDGKVEVTVNGKAYTVEVERETPKAKPVKVQVPAAPKAAAPVSAAAAPAAPQAPTAGAKTVNAPLPGNIVKVTATVGQAVKPGDVLVIMEAMKMENNIVAESEGSVSRILVQVGQTVQSGDALVEIA
ncbi:MAG: biotin/lipoyl-binding protein [Bacteroidaceae bacterium]|jgi:biotin carboxyl carrier protein|nr:biotin/lipoyl-binding protein [Bacteroidaceae bacterium]